MSSEQDYLQVGYYANCEPDDCLRLKQASAGASRLSRQKRLLPSEPAKPIPRGCAVTNPQTARLKSNPDQRRSDVPRLALSSEETCIALGIGRRLLWSLSNTGEIPSVKIGGRRLYPVAALEKYLAEQTEQEAGR